MKEVIVATKNEGKVREFRALLDTFGIRCTSLRDVKLHNVTIEETGETFRENALIKAETIAKAKGIPVLADDSGLVVDALGGKPGVYSARYAGSDATDEENNEKLLRHLEGVPEEKRSARFVCAIAFVIPGNEPIFTEGTCEGTIAEQIVGTGGFGYDPLFIPRGYDKTMAELGEAEKNNISHRFHALKQLEAILKRDER
ncbi:MAG TPA: XTP/dITP diphosphatase [Pseudogracilibacillus sp.]|nr:XTP/dITP diphosphatase [Pseudogracilibacillus sp.]